MRFRPQLSWDKVFIAIAFVFILFWLILMPLDAMRFHWSRMPVELKTLGALVLLISLYIAFLTMRENPYSSAVVRVQKERAQTVISTGPYRYVRHPMYTGAVSFSWEPPYCWGLGTERSAHRFLSVSSPLGPFWRSACFKKNWKATTLMWPG